MDTNTRWPFTTTPIVLAPIAGPGTPELTAAACNAGAFGIHASPYSTADQMRKDAARIRELTSRPFGINLFVESPLPAISAEALLAAHQQLTPYYDALGLALPPDVPQHPRLYAEQIEALIEIRPAAFSFTFGIPDAHILERVKSAGIYTIGTATTVREAISVEGAGVDAVCAQGIEAGGHRGTFLADMPEALSGTMALVPQVVDAVEIPVIAAGGITDGRGLAAALALGAVAAQCGTAFLRADEAATSPSYRLALETAGSDNTMLTTAFSGRPARGIANRFSIEMDDANKRAPYPYQNALTRHLRSQASLAENAELLSLWAGQAFRLGRSAPAAEIIREMLTEAARSASATLHALQPPQGAGA